MPEINITKGDIATALERIEGTPWSDVREVDAIVRGRNFDHFRTAVVGGAVLLADVLIDDMGDDDVAKRKMRIVADAGMAEIMATFAGLDRRA